MSVAFFFLAVLVLVSAVAAMTLRNLVHCALSLVITFASLAGLFLQLHAEFIGLAQILVYVGAVAILIVFAILLTRSAEERKESIFSLSWPVGLGVALLVFASLAAAILASPLLVSSSSPIHKATVQSIGAALMTAYVLPLEVAGLLLTTALIGAVIVAMPDKNP